MGCGCSGSIASTKRELSLDSDGILELGEDDIGGKVKNSGIEERAVLEDSLNFNLVSEGIDLELVKEGSLGAVNLLSLGDDLLVGNNFNLGLDNLGLDVKVLEESGLLWIKTSGTGGDGLFDAIILKCLK